MLFSHYLLLALAGLEHFSLAMPPRKMRRQNLPFTDLASDVDEGRILDAFREANHPDAAVEAEEVGDGTYEFRYSFNEDEWHDMALSLYSGGTSPNPALVLRQFRKEDWEFMCIGSKDRRWAYILSVAAVASTICRNLGWGAEMLGRRQVVERFGLQDINNRPLRLVFTYVFRNFKWNTALACTSAITHGITEFCSTAGDGAKGEHDITEGVSAAIISQSGETEAAMAVTLHDYDTGRAGVPDYGTDPGLTTEGVNDKRKKSMVLMA